MIVGVISVVGILSIVALGAKLNDAFLHSNSALSTAIRYYVRVSKGPGAYRQPVMPAPAGCVTAMAIDGSHSCFFATVAGGTFDARHAGDGAISVIVSAASVTVDSSYSGNILTFVDPALNDQPKVIGLNGVTSVVLLGTGFRDVVATLLSNGFVDIRDRASHALLAEVYGSDSVFFTDRMIGASALPTS